MYMRMYNNVYNLITTFYYQLLLKGILKFFKCLKYFQMYLLRKYNLFPSVLWLEISKDGLLFREV